MNGIGELINQYSATIFVYFVVICSASIFAALSYRKNNTGNYVWRRIWFILSFITLLLFLGLANCGEDYYSYNRIFDNCFDWGNPHTLRIERGYLLFNMAVKCISSSFKFFHFIWAFVILVLIYSTIAKYKDVIRPGWTILGYTSIFMIQGLDLMRMYFAIAIIFWGIRFVIQDKKIKYLLVVIAAFFVHRSALCVLVPYAMWVMFSRKEKYTLKIILTAMMYGVIYALRNVLFSEMLFGYQYGGSTSGQIGSAQIVYAFPIMLVFLYYRIYKKEYIKDPIVSNLMIFYLSSIVFALMSYSITTMGRVLFYFTYPYMVLPGYLMSNWSGSNRYRPWHKVSMHEIIGFCFILYYFFRAYMMIAYIETDGLQVYSNILGFFAN